MNDLTTTEANAQSAVALVVSAHAPLAQQGQYLTFMLDNEVFALGILAIKEIIEYHNLTVVPMMPASVRGVINLRGAVVPVVDMLARFGKASTPVTKRTCIVITEVHNGSERQDVGLIVDAVNEVIDISATDVEPPPTFGANIHRSFIAGMGKVGGRFVILLDADQVFSFDDLASLAEIAEAA